MRPMCSCGVSQWHAGIITIFGTLIERGSSPRHTGSQRVIRMGVLKSVKRAVEANIARQTEEKRQSFRRDLVLRDALLDSGEMIAGHQVGIEPASEGAVALIKFNSVSVGSVEVDRARYLIAKREEDPMAYNDYESAIRAVIEIIEAEVHRSGVKS
jgi:hypothetical protein